MNSAWCWNAPQPGLTDLYKLPETQLQSLSDFTQLLGLPDIADATQDDSYILKNREHPSSQGRVPRRWGFESRMSIQALRSMIVLLHVLWDVSLNINGDRGDILRLWSRVQPGLTHSQLAVCTLTAHIPTGSPLV